DIVALDDGDRAALRASILSRFQPDAVYAEREINARLKDWLAGVGSMIETDHVNLRRLLVDTQVLTRTSDCAEYRVHPAAAAEMTPEVAAIDAAAVVIDARNEADTRRSARKSAWLKRAGEAGVVDARDAA
ncbi:MAG: DUF2087 domain-containing protein, partial [Betaproteobacteria bacterium]